MIQRLVLFGATGDLAGRFLLPALAALRAAGELPDRFEIVAAATADLGDDGFREVAASSLAEHAADVESDVHRSIVDTLHYRQADVTDTDAVAAALGAPDKPVAAYLALPPAVFPDAVRAIGAAGLAAGSRVALEKPFGADLASAVALNRLLAEVFGARAEEVVFRVDHLLGMATAQNLLAMRLANPVLEAVWRGAHVEQVEILWEETLALEGRAGYYDGAGALKDVVQNHMLQALCLVTMELPEEPGGQLHDRKVEVLRAVRPPEPRHTRRARYGAGRHVPAYVDEDGVDPQRCTETFAEIVLTLDSERWEGTRFVLRAGKALEQRRKMAILRFRGGGELRIGLDGPDNLELALRGLTLEGEPPATNLPPYGHVLRDVLSGGDALSVRGDEAEEAWRVVTPVLDAWAAGEVPLEEYPAGSAGPS
jgi:glucose-6-phosphate 1-dehydrogenase